MSEVIFFMTIGLVILGIVAILIFFGVTEKFFRKIGLSNFFAFLVVLALVIGAVVPNIKIGSAFEMNVSGFLIPVLLVVIFSAILGANSDLSRAYIAMVAVAGVAVATGMLISNTTLAGQITASVIMGFVGGAVAYLIASTRLSTLIASIGGIVLGDIIVSLLNYYVVSSAAVSSVSLGTLGTFDAIIIAAVFGIVMVEAVAAMKRTVSRKRVAGSALSMEISEENDLSGMEMSTVVREDEFDDYFAGDEKK